MKYLDEFRDPGLARGLVTRILQRQGERRTLMDVCGGQTHNLLKYGIEQSIESVVEIIHGPGCPVCVTPAETIEYACQLACDRGVIVASFGDMLRVPGTGRSLLDARASGGDVRIIVSALDAISMAVAEPSRQVVFLAVGFETTAPSTALAIQQAQALDLQNFSIVCAHVCVLPAMESIKHDGSCKVDAFLAAGHVCTITGFEKYHGFAKRFEVPVVVTGFEPIDLLLGIERALIMTDEKDYRVFNAYTRVVREKGNLTAQRLIEDVFLVTDSAWRGMDVISGGGLVLKDRYARYCAQERFGGMTKVTARAETDCEAQKVLMGAIKPPECPLFGNLCTPRTPRGAPMVSSEGACAAYFQHRLVD